MHRRFVFGCSLLVGLAAGSTALGQAPAPAPVPITLQASLTAARPPGSGIALTVGAEKVILPKDIEMPSSTLSVDQVADVFSWADRKFGTVTAIAPPTMVVLNTSPSNPNPYDGMPPGDAFRLLAASLTNAQWRVLTSEQGLGIANLTDDLQRNLFHALFPGGRLSVYPRPDPSSHGYEQGKREIAIDAAQARLRLGRRVTLSVPVASDPRQGHYIPDAPGPTPLYDTSYDSPTEDDDVLDGVRIRAEVPNTPKDSQLDWKTPALAVPISTQGLKTVRDLVFRIGAATHLELYPDKLYEDRRLTILGTAPTASAKDLLRALTFCVCGTFRQVGPAYVLTDDVIGLGTRRAILRRFERGAEVARHGPLREAGDKILTAHAVDDLLAIDSPTDFTTEEAKAGHQNGNFPNSGMFAQLPFSQLTPEQQALVRRAKQLDDDRQEGNRQVAQAHGETYAPNDVLTLDGKIGLHTLPTLQLVLPSLDGPVVLDHALSTDFLNMFSPSDTVMEQWRRKKDAEAAPDAVTRPARPVLPSPDMVTLLQPYARRAVIAAPRTVQDVNALIVSMKKVGFNELWLSVFPTPPPDKAPAASPPPDLLAEALKVTKGSGIAVYPLMDLLVWRSSPLPSGVDLSLMGETSAQEKASSERYRDLMQQNFRSETLEDIVGRIAAGGVAVSPADSDVRRMLSDTVTRLASTPGIAGLVWRSTATPGYHNAEQSRYARDEGGVGYTVLMRLAFLRRAHTDPLDMDNDLVFRRQNTVIRGFSDNDITYPLSQQWDAFRAETEVGLLRTLFTTAQRAAGRSVPILVEQRRQEAYGRYDWFGSWERPTAPLPELSENVLYGGNATPQTAGALAKSQSKTVLMRLPAQSGLTAAFLAIFLKQDGASPPADGFVLDCEDESGGDPLAALAASVKS